MVVAVVGVALLAAVACGSDGSSDATRVRATLDLPREPTGAPDAGTRTGHGGVFEASVEGPRLAFRGRVRPEGAPVAVRGAPARVTRGADGRFVVRVGGLGEGTTRLTVRAGGVGTLAPWRRDVRVTRGPSGVGPAREPQAVEPDRGSPGVGDAFGGKRDVEVRDFAFLPRRIEVDVGQIVVFRTRDEADHTIVDTAGDSALAARRMTRGDRYEFTPLRDGVVRYACTIHPWMAGELAVVER